MKLVALSLLVPVANAWVVSPSLSSRTSLKAVEGSGMNNGYVPASAGDGGQGQFGAISPSDWKVPGTSPVGENSFGKADGADEPWFSEAVSTVEMDLAKGAETMEAFTMQAADFKVAKFADTKPYDWKSNDAGKKELIEALGGLAKFLDAGDKPIAAAWDKLHPDPVKVEAEKKKAEEAAKKKAEEAAAKKAEEAEAK
ncbi:hypothetical protein TrCOL_g3678 [Triparma columacea]|uniref:Uncharacterized protein n=1 Tax=Triparma columacea TaxID=722753 RepID=A0A9W7GP24_9STRA|nr:hypothetical protein TrCOL_g3678 [Triparma columacea]